MVGEQDDVEPVDWCRMSAPNDQPTPDDVPPATLRWLCREFEAMFEEEHPGMRFKVTCGPPKAEVERRRAS